MEFNAQEHANKIIDFIRDYYQKKQSWGCSTWYQWW